MFIDGFGTGTSFVAALRAGRHAVGAEPDPVQFEAAVNRLTAAIKVQLQADAANIRRRQARLRQKKQEQKLQEKQQKLKQRKKQQVVAKRKRSSDEEVCTSLFSHLLFRKLKRNKKLKSSKRRSPKRSPNKYLECQYSILRLVYPAIRDELLQAIDGSPPGYKASLQNLQLLFEFFLPVVSL